MHFKQCGSCNANTVLCELCHCVKDRRRRFPGQKETRALRWYSSSIDIWEYVCEWICWWSHFELEPNRQMTQTTHIKQVYSGKLVTSRNMQFHQNTHTEWRTTQSNITHCSPTHACNHTHTTQRVPKRDPRKQEMTAEGRGRSRERTDTIRSLSKRRREGGRGREEKEDTASRTMTGQDSKTFNTNKEKTAKSEQGLKV